MPWNIGSDESGGFWVTNANTGRRMNKKPLSKRRARRYQMALYANEKKDVKTMDTFKHGGDWNAKQKDSLQAIHNHSADLGAECDGTELDEEMEKHLKHGGFSLSERKDKVQAMHDHTLHLGSECPPSEAEKRASDKLELVKKSFLKNAEYAVQELGDITTAAYAIAQLCNLGSEMDEPQDAAEVANILRAIVEFINGEIDEMENAANETEAKNYKIAKREDVNPKRGKTEYGDVKFADEKNKKYPIDSEAHVRAAWNYINKEHNASEYSSADVATIKARIVSAWKEKINKDGPPSADKSFAELKTVHEHLHDHKNADGTTYSHSHSHSHAEGVDHNNELAHNHEHPNGKGLDLSYVKSLGLIDIPDMAAKYTGRNEITFPAFIWGSPAQMDIETDFFTNPAGAKGTNFFDDVYGKSPRPITWDHGQDPNYPPDNVIIGKSVEWKDDEIARWVTGVITMDKKYRKYLDEFIEKKQIGASSDSVPQYVLREKSGKGFWIKQWPWIGTALTPAPAEPRMKDYTPEFLKAWDLTLPEANIDNSREVEALKLREREIRLKSLVK